MITRPWVTRLYVLRHRQPSESAWFHLMDATIGLMDRRAGRIHRHANANVLHRQAQEVNGGSDLRVDDRAIMRRPMVRASTESARVHLDVATAGMTTDLENRLREKVDLETAIRSKEAALATDLVNRQAGVVATVCLVMMLAPRSARTHRVVLLDLRRLGLLITSTVTWTMLSPSVTNVRGLQ